jgi:peptidoglycan biosynthesis protein MviN/MurJ (putative lipid II flippase)
MEAVTTRWQSDMASDNNLSKSVRPLVLIFLIVCTILLIFVDSGFINFVVDDEWKDLLKVLLMTTVAAYFGGRSYEKGQKMKMQ